MTAVVPVADGGELFDLLLFGPVGVADVELTDGLESLRRTVGPACSGRTLFVLVRLHTHPIGCLALADDSCDPALDWPVAVCTTLGGSIESHLLADGLEPDSLDLWAGGGVCDNPPCLEERRRTVAAARAVTVIIATRDRPERLDACLDTLLALEYPDFDIVVVDNDPTSSDTAELVADRGAETGRITYLREELRGLGAAHNCGLAAATGSIVAFADDDVAVDRHWLSELAAPFVADPRVAGATGLILPAELEVPTQVMLEAHGRFAKGFEDRLYDLGPNRPDDVLFPFAAGKLGSGANMAFETEWLRGIGGFVAGVRSVQAQDPAVPEIIVVVDHNDTLVDRIRRELPEVTVTVNAGRRGLSGARNAGVAAATGDVVAFLDDDAEADHSWLAHLVERYRDADVLGVGGSVTPKWSEERPHWFPPEFNWVVGCSYHGMPETTAPVRNFIGTNMSFRRDALVTTGGFDAGLGRVGADASGCEPWGC